MKLKYGIIYKIENLVNGKIYIGQTIHTIKSRWLRHCKASSHLGLSIRKYGENNFHIIEIDFATNQEDLDKKEKYWISYYKSYIREFGYNIQMGGRSNAKGLYKLTKEKEQKIILLDNAGMTHIKIAELFGINRKTVTFILRRNIDYKNKRIKWQTREDLQDIIDFIVNNNPTAKECREKFKIGNNTLFKIAKSINYHFLTSNKRYYSKNKITPRVSSILNEDENVLRTAEMINL